jgi:DNA-binding transcriptional LysR family regulator
MRARRTNPPVQSDRIVDQERITVRNELSALAAFLMVAEQRSFTKAAKQLNISTSGLSHAIKRLEEQIGVRLLARTTRSVSPTVAGEQLLAHLGPALADIHGTLTNLSQMQTRPVGRLRVLCCRLAVATVLVPKLAQFARDYPEIELDITSDDGRVDLVSAGYDVGIQFGEYLAQDVVAVRVSPDLRPAVVGAPAYFDSHPKPTSPQDLLNHRCIRFRHRLQSVYKWELDKGSESFALGVNGSLILDDLDLVIQVALEGAGLAWLAEDRVTEHLASGALVRVLEDWCPPFPGFFLYYPSRKQQPAALAALVASFRIDSST